MLGLRTRFFVASTVILFACGVRAETWRLYHNERFGTTADVPADWSMNPPVDADDGRSFSSPDKRAKIAVSGLFSDTSIAEKMAIRTKPHEGETITYQKRGPRWIVVTGTSGDRIFYRKSIVTWRDSIWNDLSIEYPAAEKEKYEALVAHVGASLRGEQGDDAFVRAFRIIKEHHLLTPKMQRCSFLRLREDSTVRIWGIGAYEIHNKRCGGAPEVAPRLFDLEIDMQSGAAKWDYCGGEEMRPIPKVYTSYEVFRASCP